MILFFRKIFSGIFGVNNYQKYFNNYVGKNSMLLFAMHCISIMLVFMSNYILIKVGGVNNYGGYIYLFNLIYLLVTFSILGLDTLLVKKVAVYHDARKFPELKGIFFFALAVIIISSLFISACFKLISTLSGSLNILSKINWFVFAFLSIVMLSALTLSQVILQGMKKIAWSQLGEKILRPLLLITLLLIFYFFLHNIPLENLAWINVLSIGLTLLIVLILFRKVIGHKLKNVHAVYDIRNWAIGATSFFVVDVLYNVNARISIFLLGTFKSEETVGIYNVALRVSEVVSFALVIVNFVLSPAIAKLYANGKKEKLQLMITRSSRVTLLIGSLPAAGIILFRKNILLIFGLQFLQGEQALIFLSIGQFINILCGSVGLLLLMTGNQKYSIYSMAAGTVINLILNFLLIPKYGIAGSAIASSASLIVWNLLMYIFVRRKLDIRTTAFGFI